MNQTEYTVNNKAVQANPSSLGLFGLAMVTLVAASQKFGWTEGTSLIIPWAIFLGAGAQLYASIIDSKLNNLFGATVFGAFSLFWFSVGTSWMIQNGVFGEAMMMNADGKQLGFAFIGYAIFGIYATIASMSTNKALFAIMIAIDGLLISLSFLSFGIAPEFFHTLAAWSELATSLLGFYAAAATLINGQYKKTILPVGKPFNIFN